MSTIADPEIEIEDRYKASRKLIGNLGHQLSDLESEKDTSVLLQGRIAANINALARHIEALHALKQHLPTTKRDVWALKIKKLSDEEKQTREAMERYLLGIHRQRQATEAAERRRHQSGGGGFGGDENGVEAQLSHDSSSLDNSRRMAYELLDIGQSVLGRLREQNLTLKAAKRRLLDIGTTLGLSRTVMRLIERRQLQDQIIVYSGMLVLVLVFVWLIYYFRW